MYEWSLLSLIYKDFLVYDKKNRKLNKAELLINLENNNHWIKDKNDLLNNLPAQKNIQQ